MERVELIDARDRLEELLIRASRGEQFVLTEAGRGMALLTAPPPPPPTPEEIAAIQARAEEAFERIMAMREARLAELEGGSNDIVADTEFGQ